MGLITDFMQNCEVAHRSQIHRACQFWSSKIKQIIFAILLAIVAIDSISNAQTFIFMKIVGNTDDWSA